MTESSVFNSSVGGFVINMMKLEVIQLVHICNTVTSHPKDYSITCILKSGGSMVDHIIISVKLGKFE